ncbi:MAG: hypothetical protein QG608_3291 [Actinomycetota bacterium]|nr:hypothetical protein [Actinomycetota bacterium]
MKTSEPPRIPQRESVEHARSLLRNGGRRLLGIAGPPGSGKSTLAASLVAALGDAAVLVPMDGFHLAQAELERLGRADRKGAPDTFDALGFVALLRRLRSADEPVVYAPRFHREIEESIAGAIVVPRTVPLVIIEGNYLLLQEDGWGGVRPELDTCWYIDLDDAERVRRLVDRHVRHGRTRQAATQWVIRTDEANAALIAGTRFRADLAVVR